MACWNARIGQGLVFWFSKGRRLSTIGTGSLLCELALCCSSHLKFSCFLHFNMYGSLLVPDCCTWLQLGKMQ
jgi:hypothetical protein